MSLEIKVDNNKLEGFNPQAQYKLKECIEEFVEDIIAESNRLESTQNTTANGPEITSSMVSDARVMLRHKINKPKKRVGHVVVRILAAVLPLACGLMYNQQGLQQGWYMVLFVLIVVAAITMIIVSIILE